ncbi:hypothetical protein M514_14779 [Trichuris suis]|uniref:Uncharacterized protein n=1 Tax=Trichuris suis TaxID=68888 RepID=A0A085NTS9_9BILA|nr:hypothetical protein M514_14779 [Trichuris suis]
MQVPSRLSLPIGKEVSGLPMTGPWQQKRMDITTDNVRLNVSNVLNPWIQYRSSSLTDWIAAIVKNGFCVLVLLMSHLQQSVYQHPVWDSYCHDQMMQKQLSVCTFQS